MRIIRIISRILLGITFIFSGFVKGVDPLGTAYKIEDYFIAFGTDWAIPMALPISILLVVTEFSLGIFLLFNIFRNFSAWLALLMMVFFTFLTLNDAIYNPVPDCGCFGDFIVLTNWQTFYKNLVIDLMLIFVFITRKKYDTIYLKTTEWSLAILSVGVFTLFTSYNLYRLPVIDFRDWKVGKKLTVDNPKPLEYYLIYTNKNTGESKEYLSPNYPYNDSTWMAEWQYSDMRIVDPNIHPTDVSFFDLAGQNVTDYILGDPLYHFLLISYDLTSGDWENLDEIKDLMEDAEENAYSFSLVTASNEEIISNFEKENHFYPEVYQSDDIDLKTIIRSNPGIIVLKKGVVMGKYPSGHIPEYKELMNEFGASKN